eukprot:TRINITY_DN3706_c0_g6_i1.p1 TRINITY_DN3706_c0_g6~~TRINITY_DN3706_c0_g6_i1.p1  ORF type:complete len:366 (+),score=70.63 TRINITY_DN3706_c0_g6_i1:158-1255(+)
MTERFPARTQRAIINLRGITLYSKKFPKPARISINRRRNANVRKMNDFEFKTMVEKYKSQKDILHHIERSNPYFQTGDTKEFGERNSKLTLIIVGGKSSLFDTATKSKVHSSRSMKNLLTGEITQDEKITKMLRIADHMKLNMRSSDNLLDRLSAEQGIRMKHMDKMLDAASQRVQEVKESLYCSARRLRKIIRKKEYNADWQSTKKLPEKESKKFVWTTDVLRDVHESIKLKEKTLQRLKQENRTFEISENSKETIKINTPKQIARRVKKIILKNIPKGVSREDNEGSIAEIKNLPLHIESIKAPSKLAKCRPFTKSGAKSTHSTKTEDTATLKPAANSHSRNAELRSGKRNFTSTLSSFQNQY